MKKIGIIGSTGSIGQSTLDVVRHLGPEYKVTALATWSNIDLLEAQALEFRPEIVAVQDKAKALELQKRLPGFRVTADLEEAAAWSNVDIVMSSLLGTAGLLPTIAAIKAGKTIALANKETLVSGGAWIMSLAKQYGVKIIPVDSEHSAIFQCLQGESQKAISRLILTASGGPFRNYSVEQLKSVSCEEALNHPTWKMGPKITVDCSTLMNKGLEVIEACWLFDIPVEQIEVVIHPQSVVHSCVEFVDGSMLAQMSVPTMVVPIQYALTYPHRQVGMLKPFDFIRHPKLEFSVPDMQRFRCLAQAFIALESGKSMPCYMNAANEVLVQRFLKKEIGWAEIGEKLENLMTRHRVVEIDSLEAVLGVDQQAREEAIKN